MKVQDLVGIVLVVAVIWKLYQLSRAPHDEPLRGVTFCLTSAALAYPFGISAVAKPVDAAIGAGMSMLIQNVLLFATVYWLMCFYLFAASDVERGRRRARWETIPLATAVVLVVVSTFITPPEARGAGYDTAHMHVIGLAGFYLFGGIYLAYALAAALYWTVRYAKVSHRPLATGLWVAAVAMAAMVLGAGIRSILVVIRALSQLGPSSVQTTADSLVAFAIPLFIVGVSYPSVATRLAALGVWWQHRRLCRQLTPLWTLLHEAYPEDALSRVPAGRWRDLLRLRGVHRRYYRRVIECRDGLVRVSPYLATLGTLQDGAVPAGELDQPVRLASALRAALLARAAGQPVAGPAMPIAIPDGDGLDADVRQLVALSRALRASSPASPVEAAVG